MENPIRLAVFLVITSALAIGIFADPRVVTEGFEPGDQILVNTYTTGPQDQSGVSSAADGSFVVVWTSGEDFLADGNGPDGSYTAVQARRYDDAGRPLGGEFTVNTYTPSYQRFPDVAHGPGGDFLVVWSGPNSADSDPFSRNDILGQWFDSSGTPQGGEFLVNAQTAGFQSAPTIEFGGDQFVVSWESNVSGSPEGMEVVARRLSSSGAPIGNDIAVNTYTTGDQGAPEVGLASDGSFVVAWTDNDQAGAYRSVRTRRFLSDGSPHTNEFRVDTVSGANAAVGSASYGAGGEFIVSWWAFPGLPPGGFARFDSNGQHLGTDGELPGFVIVDHAVGGDFVAVWTDYGLDEISARRYDSSGQEIGNAFEIAATAGSYREIAFDEAGSFVVTWSAVGDGDETGIYSRKFLMPIFADGFESGDVGAWSP